jgi:hypothetical protein
MKKKNDEFLASPIYHARSLPQTHRTKVQILIVRFFSPRSPSLLLLLSVRSLPHTLSIYIISRVFNRPSLRNSVILISVQPL